MINLPDSSTGFQTAKFTNKINIFNKINNRKNLFNFVCENLFYFNNPTFFTSITQPCQDLVEPFFLVHMKHGKKNVNIGWRVNADIIRLLFFLGWSKYINKINNRKDFFDFVHNPTKLFFFVPMNRRQKMLILVRGLILNLLGPCL